MRNRTKKIIAAACQMEVLEPRALYSTSIDLDASAVQTLLNGSPQFQPAMSYNGNYGVLVSATPASGGTIGSAIHAQLLDPSGATTGSSIVVNSAQLTLDDHPAVAVAADGSFIVAWTANTTVYFQHFSSSGTPVGTATSVSGTKVADNASIAYTTNGNFVITYQAMNGSKGLDVFAQLYNANGTANGSAFVVNTTTAGSQQNARVSSDAAGDFVVVWQNASGGANLDDIDMQQFSATGAMVGTQTLVNTTVAGEQADPDIAMMAAGSFVVAWDSTGTSGTEIDFQQYDSTGAASGTQTTASVAGVSVQSNPAVAMDYNGVFGVAWVQTTLTSADTEVSYYLPDGSLVTGPVNENQQGQYGERPALAFLPSGATTLASGAALDGTVTTDLETLAPDLTITGLSGVNNVISATFDDLLLTVDDNGSIDYVPSGILQNIDIEGGNMANTISITGTSTSYMGNMVVNANGYSNLITIGDLPTVQINGGYGNDTISVGSGDDSITAGGGNDSITGGSGSDILEAGNGNDTIVSGTGNSILQAGNGNDTLFANNLGERLEVGNGNSIIHGGTGNDTINTGSGNDTIYGGGGEDSILTNAGNALVYLGQGGASTVTGSTGSDTVSYALDTAPVFAKLGGFSGNGPTGENDFLGTAVHNVVGGSGNDTLIAGPGTDSLYGGAGNDLLEAAGGSDLLDGNSGDDTLLAGSGSDTFIGASGVNTLSFAHMPGKITATIDGLPDSGWNGQKDTIGLTIQNIIAGTGSDVITGSNSNNVITGGSGSDTLLGMGGNDTIFAGSGNDYINGGSGNDWIKGGAGIDELDGGTGNDMIYAGTGNDTLHGNTGNDTLFGGTGIDDLYGDAGDDTLYTGKGHTILNGGSGANTAVVKAGDIVASIQKIYH